MDYTVLYNAPYTPQLNPIEETFSLIKREVRNKTPKNLKELENTLFWASKLVTFKISRSFIYSSLKWMKNCLENKNIP
jgi:transposase